MALKVVRTKVCDLCGAEPVERFTVTFPDSHTRSYDLCVDCAEPIRDIQARTPGPARRYSAARSLVPVGKVKKARSRR